MEAQIRTQNHGVFTTLQVAVPTSVSNTWKAYENGSAGTAQPPLPEGYSWVKNAKGDLGIKTPEEKVVLIARVRERDYCM